MEKFKTFKAGTAYELKNKKVPLSSGQTLRFVQPNSDGTTADIVASVLHARIKYLNEQTGAGSAALETCTQLVKDIENLYKEIGDKAKAAEVAKIKARNAEIEKFKKAKADKEAEETKAAALATKARKLQADAKREKHIKFNEDQQKAKRKAKPAPKKNKPEPKKDTSKK